MLSSAESHSSDDSVQDGDPSSRFVKDRKRKLSSSDSSSESLIALIQVVVNQTVKVILTRLQEQREVFVPRRYPPLLHTNVSTRLQVVQRASLAVDRNRRVNTLLKMTEDYKKAKELLDKNEDVISQSGNCLFGEGFKKVLKMSSKTWEEASKIAFSIKKGGKI
ncbi:unnamed protein product [Mytilus coruscus]|uniref:Uncharacterized protein n=1 Tax=Mytilus coruscus TaxID=42192 RepID=A0A6J8CT83_MYTCO|nr:unnamed protein product [Mytilus coruscus]